MTREAVIVSTARTGLAKSGRGGFNITHGAAMAGHAVKHSIERAKLDPNEIEDVIMGCGTPEGASGGAAGTPPTGCCDNECWEISRYRKVV